jgi:hypothetical protein
MEISFLSKLSCVWGSFLFELLAVAEKVLISEH